MVKVKIAKLRKNFRNCGYFCLFTFVFVFSFVYLFCVRVFLCEYKYLIVCGEEIQTCCHLIRK